MLRGEKLGKRFGRRAVFRGLDFSLETGRVAAVVGANGTGKSTLLRIVAGLMEPTIGHLSWTPAGGEKLDGSELTALCGLSAPDAPVYRELTALENLQFIARLRGLAHTETALVEHLDRWKLKSRRDDFAGDLSSGLRTRLQLAVATLPAPPILLLDEPSANLDDAGRALLHELLEEQRSRGLALVATNDSREVALCDEQIRVEVRE